MKVIVNAETAKLLKDGKLVDSGTGVIHSALRWGSAKKLRFVGGSYVRVLTSVADLPETAYAVSFLGRYPDGMVPRGLGRTDRWRLAKLVKCGYACKLKNGMTLVDPNRWSRRGCPVDVLPESFR